MSLLPEKKTIPKQKFNEVFKLYYGAPNSGKSSTAGQNPNALFAMFEDGLAGMSAYGVNIPQKARKLGKSEWQVFLDLVEEFLNEEHNFNELVIDTADRGIEACTDYTKEMEGISDLSDQEWGKGWRNLFDNFKKPIEDLQMSEFGCTVLSHSEMKDITDAKGRTRTKIVPSLTGKSGSYLVDQADIVVLFDKDEDNNRLLRVESTKNFDAKQRIQFPDGDIPAGNSPEEAYKNLRNAFKKAVKINNKKFGITKKQIEEYYEEKEKERNQKTFKQLINDIAAKCQELGLSKKDNAKEMKEKYGTPSLGKLTYEQAQDRVEELKGRL